MVLCFGYKVLEIVYLYSNKFEHFKEKHKVSVGSE
jgi:hypothetical protein